MPIGTFSELKAAVASWIKRSDLTASIPDFITLAEARFNRELRTRQQMTGTSLVCTPGTATIALPAGWAEFISLKLANPSRVLVPRSVRAEAEAYIDTETGAPVSYAIQGSDIVLGPTPDLDYSIATVYYANVPALSDGAPTNWLLTAAPMLYLAAAMAEACPFVWNDERTQVWEGKYMAELESLRTADRRASQSGGPMRVRAR